MRTFAPGPGTTHQPPSARPTLPARVGYGQSRAVTPVIHSQQHEEQPPIDGLLRLAYDFSRIPVQRRHVETGPAEPEGRSRDGARVEIGGLVTRGLGGSAAPLPYLPRIQSSFGRHDVTGVSAHLGPEAADANRRLGAAAYTAGSRIAFAGFPSLHTAAHEAAHVVQQRRGVVLKNNVGEPGDAYEKHADRVADLVVQGARAEPLLDQVAGPGRGAGRAGAGATGAAAVQMLPLPKRKPLASQGFREIPGLRDAITQWASINKIKSPMMRAIAKEYVNRRAVAKEYANRRVVHTYLYAAPTYQYGNPSSNNAIPGVHEPDEERVFSALMAATDLKKVGKGDKPSDWSFSWRDEPGPSTKKTAGEKGMEVGKFGTEQAASKVIDKTYDVKDAARYTIEPPYITRQLVYSAYQKSAANLAVVGAESVMTGAMSATSVVEAVSEPVARWVMKNVLHVSAEVATRAIPVIGWIWLAYDVADLLISLGSPAEGELSPYQAENAGIIAGVKAFLEKKEGAAAMQAALKKPFNPAAYIKPLPNDATAVRRR